KSKIPSPRKATSTVSPCGPVSTPQKAFQDAKPFQTFQVAFIGRTGSGRNSLAWRMKNLNDSELPTLPFSPRREIILETSTRPALRHQGVVELQIRIVPPEDLHGQPFFDRNGGINECDVIVFVVDLRDERSSNEFYTLYRKAQRHSRRGMPPFLIVGSKVDLRLFGVVTPHRWGENTANLYSARAYLECSAKTNDRVGDVLDAILRILL
ncbi:unnamed protein product, partial [Larinioides sclopetarius]